MLVRVIITIKLSYVDKKPFDDDCSFNTVKNKAQDKAQFKAQNKAQDKAQDKAAQLKAQDKTQDKAQNKAQLKAQLKLGERLLTEQLVLEYLRKYPKATQADIANSIGKSRTSIQGVIIKLKEKGLLERDGAKKNGSWIVK